MPSGIESWKDIISTISPLLTLILALLGYLITHKLTSNRDLKNKKREIIIKHRLDTLMKLSNAVHREQNKNDFEDAITEIQLLGTSEQVALAKKAAEEVSLYGFTDIDELISSLRNDLRTELNLKKTDEPFKWLRFKP